MNTTPRHKVFVSFCHQDQCYKDNFVDMMEGDIVDKSVEDGDIDDDKLLPKTIRRKIRDEFIGDATVTVVLVGPCTWQRKHVDWEIGSSLRRIRNARCGLLGILLPNHTDYQTGKWTPGLIPPRLADNCGGGDPFARIYDWSNNSASVRSWIHTAFERRDSVQPDNRRPQFPRNQSGNCSQGWS